MTPSLPHADRLAAAGLRLEQQGSVVTISLDRPEKRNAQTPTMWRTLAAIGAGLPDDVRVVVVRGEGPSFSAGLDRSMHPGAQTNGQTNGQSNGQTNGQASGEESVADLAVAGDDERAVATIADYQAGFTFLRDPRFVSVAAVQGHAVGAGFQLALACDLRVAAEDATFIMKESALGLVPDLAGTKPLVEAVGYARALEICVTARAVPAAEALALGLVQAVVGVDALDETATGLAALLAGTDGAVLAETKALLLGAGERDLAEQCRLEREAQVRRLRALAGEQPGAGAR